MSEGAIMRTLRGHLTPQQIASILVSFDSADRNRWGARVELIGGRDRWFKGKGKKFEEETWRLNEDPHNQVCRP